MAVDPLALTPTQALTPALTLSLTLTLTLSLARSLFVLAPEPEPNDPELEALLSLPPSAPPAASTLTTRIVSLLIIDLPGCEM